MSDDNSGLLVAQWNRFNDAFKQPDSEDAQLIAAKVHQSFDSWITASLGQLQQSMTVNLSATVDQLNTKLTQTVKAVTDANTDFQAQVTAFQAVLNNTTGLTDADKAAMNKAIAALQGTVDQSLKAWKDAGSSAVTTVSGIVSNVIGLAK
jgi:hypothetical protein